MPLIHTILGDIDESLLEAREGVLDNENEHTTWTAWYLNGKEVWRKTRIQLKKPALMVGGVPLFGSESGPQQE